MAILIKYNLYMFVFIIIDRFFSSHHVFILLKTFQIDILESGSIFQKLFLQILIGESCIFFYSNNLHKKFYEIS